MSMLTIGRALPVFSLAILSLAILCIATAAAPAGFANPPVPPHKLPDPLVKERSMFVTGLRASASGMQDPVSAETLIDVLTVDNLPLGISNASIKRTERGDWLKLSISNNSNEQILGVRYWLLVLEPNYHVRAVLDHSDGLKLDAYSAKAVSFPVPPRWKLADDDRVFMVLAQVIGRDSIWEVQQAKNALLAYVKGSNYTMPTVLHMLNQVDSPIGPTPIFLKQKP